MDDPIVIDTKMHGISAITAAFVVRGERTAVVETGPRNTVHNVIGGLEAAGVDRLDWIVVTHVHLDHAGAAGTLAQRFPEATVAVHEVGAPHLADPTKLWKSATRIYGDDMERLWGGIDPIDPARIRALSDGDVIDLGGRTLTAHDTPGHAYHHHAYVDDATGTLFCGDALGVRLPDVGLVRPATPPPELDLEAALASIERIRALRPTRVYFTHFGPQDGGVAPAGVDEVCDAAAEGLRLWAGWVEEARAAATELDDVARIVGKKAREAMEGRLDDDAIERLENTTSTWMNTWGYMRYFDKKQAG